MTCALPSGSARAEEQVDERNRAGSLGRPVEQQRLAEVRGGALSDSVVVQPIGVILWDELRPPVPPVRNSSQTQNVTAEMNTFRK